MWGRALRLCHKSNASRIRTYLSTAYKCDKEWSARSSARALRSIVPDEFYVKLDQHSQVQGISPIDVDVFANCATPNHLGELRDLLHKFRCTAHAHEILSSTHYATVRVFAEAESEAIPDLLNILNDRLNYGLYLDRFSANILFDKCLKSKDFESAAAIAGLLMLQENFESPIAEQFALYSAYKYLLIPIVPPPPKVEVVKEPSGKKKKIEEIKIRVGFLRNPFFDDHFDLTDLRMIAGKTLAKLTSHRNDASSLDCNLLGLVSYHKYNKAKNVAKKLAEKGTVYKETVDAIKNIVETYSSENKENLTKLEEISSTLNSITVVDKSMEEEIMKNLLDTIKIYEKDEIEEQIQTLSMWEKVREAKLQDQLEKLEEMRKERERKAREDKIKDLDEKIAFFDNEEKIDLQIENKKFLFPKRYFGKKKVSKTVDKAYIPPEITRQKS